MNMNAMRATASVVTLNTRLFHNCVVDVSDEKALQRLNGVTNSLAFIACHLVDSRYFISGFLGLELVNPFSDLLANATGVDVVPELPRLNRIRECWTTVSRDLEACLADLGSEDIARPSHQRFPVNDSTVGGAIAFLVQHESYHIGQLALLRKYLGYPSMTYG
jgi:uncharacterized damage-inducible protein DinB